MMGDLLSKQFQVVVTLSIDKEGLIYQDGQNIGQVGVFVFEDPLTRFAESGWWLCGQGRRRYSRISRPGAIHYHAGLP